ncbi:MAG TPA: GNAT family N-acetyltransferase [Candidatus Paceibacterota bacterium]
MKEIVLKTASAEDMEKVREFYVEQNYPFGVDPGCTIVLAQTEHEIVGVVRVCTEHGVLVLRGMQIKPEFQRKGLGSKMLSELKGVLEGKECFAIPYAHLEGFYRQAGFKKIEDREAPKFLEERVACYREKHQERGYIIIKKPADI